MWMDYVTIDGANNGYLWNFNNDYNSNDLGVNYAAVAFDILAGYTDYFNPNQSEVNYGDFGFSDPYPATLVLTIDSVWIFASHENNSGQYDKFIVELIELDAQGELNGPVLWSRTDSTNQGMSPGNEYLAENAWYYVGHAPNLLTAPGQRIGVRFQYIDPTKSDSMALYAGLRQVPGVGGITQPSAYPNSFVSFPYFWQGVQRNAQCIYPANGQYFLAQNWGFWLRVVVDAVLPIPYEPKQKPLSIFPNPADPSFSIMWNRASGGNMEIEILDPLGRMVKKRLFQAHTLSSDFIQMDISDLPSGNYLVKVISGQSVSASKLMVQH